MVGTKEVSIGVNYLVRTVRLGSIHDPAMGALSIPLSPNRFGYFFAQGILLWVERSLRVRSCESVGCSRRTKPPRQATIDFGPLWCWICWIRFWKFSKSRCRIEQTPSGFERSDVRSSVGIVLPVERSMGTLTGSRFWNFEIQTKKFGWSSFDFGRILDAIDPEKLDLDEVIAEPIINIIGCAWHRSSLFS